MRSLLWCLLMATTQITTNDGLSTLYIPERSEIWRDNSGNAGNTGAGEWVITRILMSDASPQTAIALPRRPIGEIMRRDPTTGWVYVPTYAGTLFSGPKYLQVVNPPALGVLGEVSVGTDFGWAFWQFNPFNGDMWSLNEGTKQFRIYDKVTGSILNYFDADTSLSNSDYSGSGQFIFTAVDKLWVLKSYTVGSGPAVQHVVLQRYDVSTLPDGPLAPEFELDLAGVGYCLTLDVAQNVIWFLFNTPDYGSPFGAGLTELKKFDLASETVTVTTTMPSGIVVDTPEMEIMYVDGGTLWIANEDTAEGTLYGVTTATGAVDKTILLSPYEGEGCFGGTIAFADSTYVWHGDAGCGFIYRTEKGACIPSTGGGGGPGGGGSGSPAFLWVMKNGAWRPVPTPSATTDNVQVMANGAWRPARKGWVMKNGAWRELPQGNPSVNGDPGTPDGPPLPSCDDPTPWIPVDPEPLTDRLFFVWEMAVNLINATPFTAVVTSLGSWTPGDIATAVGLGGQIVSSQGNYTKFQTGGAYDPAKMDAWIASQIPIEAGLNVAGYYGCSVIDDFNWPPVWPPSGVSKSEIARFCAVWKAQFPWQRLTIRGRPRELLGQNFSGLLDSCIAQWHTRFGDPTAFRTAELAAAASIGVPAILWSMNFTNGGDGSSGIPGTLAGMWEMSAAEVLAVGSVFTDPATEATGIANHGVGGWKCNRPGNPPILSRSGMVAALTTVRNQLAAL